MSKQNGHGPGKRAVLYARVSGDDRGKDGRNLAGQLEMCREYAEHRGWRVVAELAEDDRGASGATLNLPQLSEALHMAAAGDYDVLVTRELDRLSRSLAKQLIVEEELRQSGVEIAYVLGEYEDSPEGMLMKNVRAVVAEYERLKISERSSRARRRLVRQGNVILHGADAPYGYTAVEVDGKTTLEIDEEQAAIVRQIFDLYAGPERLSMRKIAKKLTALHVDSPADTLPGRQRKERPRGVWSVGIVSKILKRETYAGTWYYGASTHDTTEGLPSADVPAIISRDVWDKVCKRRKGNKAFGGKTRYDYLLRSQLKCGKCGAAIVGKPSRYTNSKGEVKTYLYYRCAAQSFEDNYSYKCNRPGFRVDIWDGIIWDWIKGFLANPAKFRQRVEAYRAQQEQDNAPLQNRLGVIDGLLAAVKSKTERLVDAYLAGDFARAEFSERKHALEQEAQALQKERAGVVADMDAQSISDEAFNFLMAIAEELSLGVEEAEEDFKVRRQLVESLGLTGKTMIIEGEQHIKVRCEFGAEALLSLSTDSRSWT